MPEIWKIEWHCLGANNEAVGWHGNRWEADRQAKSDFSIVEIVKVIYYHSDIESVWKRAS